MSLLYDHCFALCSDLSVNNARNASFVLPKPSPLNEEIPVRQRKISLGQPMHPPKGEIITMEKNLKAATLPHPILETLKTGKHLLCTSCCSSLKHFWFRQRQ